MRFLILALIVLIIDLGANVPVTDRPSAIQNIKYRNGDVYILMYPSNGTAGTGYPYGVWRFIRGEDYPDDTKYKRSHLPGFTGGVLYSGLTVDKFARIFVFREVPTAAASVLSKTAVYPGENSFPGLISTDITRLNAGGSGCAMVGAMQGAPPGWVYAISDNGNEGWVQYYNSSGTGTGYSLTQRNPSFLPGGTEILPPKFKSVNAGFIYNAHGGFWGGTGATPSIEIAGAATGGSVYCGNGSANGGARYAEWSQGATCGTPLHPMVGSFFMHPVKTGHNNSNLAAVRVCDVEVETRKLYLDQYMVSGDKTALDDSVPYLVTGGENLASPPSPDTLYANNKTVAVSVGSNTVYARFNHCGDQCGAPGVQAPTILTKPGKAVGAVSSSGVNDSQQRLYILKTSTSGGTYVTGILMSQDFNPTEILRQVEGAGVDYTGINANQEFGYTDTIGSRFSHDKFVVDAFQSMTGWGSSITAVQTSKRTDDLDWVYRSNPPKPNYFRVSESFWGTGGIMWFLQDPNTIGGATIKKLQINHETGHRVEDRTIAIPNDGRVIAFGADGDGFIYWLEEGFVESLDDLKSILGGASPTWNKISGSGKLVSPAGLPSPAAGEQSVQFTLTVKREAGMSLKKTVTGGQPFLVGTVPSSGNNCNLTLISYSADPDAAMDWADPSFTDPAYTDCGAPGINSNLTVEMAVVNVANPPASSGDFTLDIVNVPEIVEGQRVKFYMENPPRFDGPPAQLAQAGGPVESQWVKDNYGAGQFCKTEDALRRFHYAGITGAENPNGYVRTVSNYTASGNDIVLAALDAADGETARNLFKDIDAVDGMNLPSFVLTDIPSTSCTFPFYKGKEIVVSGYNTSSQKYDFTEQDQSSTLRVRWEVRALSPPLSLKTAHPNVAGIFGVGGVKRVCRDIVTGNSETFSPMDEPGLVYFECYHDIPIKQDVGAGGDTDGDGVADQTEVISPDILFPDPGVYQIKLSMKGFRWVADDLTFEDDSTGVSYEVTEATATYIVNVQPQMIKGDGSVHNVGIMNRDTSGSASGWHNAHKAKNWDGIDKIQNHETHMVVTEATPMPMVAEATIDFFHAVDKRYIDGSSSEGNLLQKFDGVGTWDFSYPGDNGNGGSNDKRSFHPPNFGGSVGAILVSSGNDATNDPQANPIRDDSGNWIYDPKSPPSTYNNQVDHIQGTYSLDSYYDTGDMSNSYSAMFDWWEIKYYWFVRYKHPVTGHVVGPFLVRQGNLSEIWALHNFAPDSESDYVAPTLYGGSTSWSSGEFIKKDTTAPSTKRRYKVRVPLMKNTICINAQEIGDPDCVVDWNGIFGKSDFRTIAKGNYSVLGNRLGLYDFPVPTEPTSLEFSFFIDYPRMRWMPRNPSNVGISQYKSGTGISYGSSPDSDAVSGVAWDPTLIQDAATYFDAVYWGPRSDMNVQSLGVPFAPPDPMDSQRTLTQRPPFDNRIGGISKVVNISIGANNVPDIQESDKVSPLDPRNYQEVAINLWGGEPTYYQGGVYRDDFFDSMGGIDGTGNYARPGGDNTVAGNDNWFDVVIRDDTPPAVSAVDGMVSSPNTQDLTGSFYQTSDLGLGGFSGNTGGLIETSDGLSLMVIDNNPYQHWTSYDVGGDGPIDPGNLDHWAPFLQQAYYEVGADPRNLTGLGLQTGLATRPCVPGYFSSRPQNPDLAESTNFKDWEDQLSRGIRGEEFFRDSVADQAVSNGCVFHFPRNFGFSISDHNQRFYTLDAPDGNSLTKPFLDPSGTHVFGFSRPSSISTTKVDVIGSGGLLDTEDNAFYVMTMGTHEYGKAVGGGYSVDEAMIRFIGLPQAYPNLDSSSNSTLGRESRSYFSHLYDGEGAYRKTYWWMPQDAFVMPYFLTSSSGGKETFNVYAKAYDISRLSLQRSGVTHPFGREDIGTGMATRGQEPTVTATKVASFLVTDNRPPNIKVTFFDYKETQLFRMMLLDDYAHIYEHSKPEGTETTNVVLIRTADPRPYYDLEPQIDFFSGRLPEADDYTYRLFEPHSVKNLAGAPMVGNPGALGNGAGLFNVKIAEDVRFRIKVEATDNSSLPEDLTIEIASACTGSGGSAQCQACVGASCKTFSPSRTDTVVEQEYRFPGISSTTKIYQYQGFSTGYHLYPKNGFYDLIRVRVSDKLGNFRELYFPIEITPQDVHFRSLGDQSKVR